MHVVHSVGYRILLVLGRHTLMMKSVTSTQPPLVSRMNQHLQLCVTSIHAPKVEFAFDLPLHGFHKEGMWVLSGY